MDNTKNSPESPAEFSSSQDDDCKLQELHSRPLLGLQLEMAEPLFAKLEARMAAAPPPEAESSSSRKSRSREQYHHQSMSEKLKASNFPISSISVGAWKRVHTGQEGELTAKLYFAKRKLVWEFLDGQLKSKMEVAWSDIIAIRALMLPNQHGVLEIELSNPPLFSREITPLPRKHTNWQQASDFTSGQALLFRRHLATFPPGALDKHYDKLLQCDHNLFELSKRPFPSQRSPYFNNISEEQQTLFFHHQHPPPHYPINASSLPSPPLYPTPLNPNITQELGFVNFSHMDEMAYSRNNQPATWENQTFDFLNDARFMNDDAIYVNHGPRFVEPSSTDHHFYYEHPSMAEECAFYEDVNPMNVSSTSYSNNLSDQKQVMTMVQNNAVIDDHRHYNLMFPPPPPLHLPRIQGCSYGVNQELGYDRDLGDGGLAQILYSSTHRVQDSPTDDVQHDQCRDP